MQLKQIRTTFVLYIALLATVFQVKADTSSDIERLLDWAETTYPDLFFPAASTLTFEEWTYRYYSATDTYAGVNDKEEVYVMGGAFGDLTKIGTLAELLTLVPGNGSSDEAGIITAGTGSCVTAVYPDPVGSAVHKTTLNGTQSSYYITNSVIESDSSHFVTQSENTPAIGTGTTTATYNVRLDGNSIYMLGYEYVTSTTNANGTETIRTSIATLNPEQLAGTKQQCEGQVFKTQNVVATVESGGTQTSLNTGSALTTVEAVNEAITVPAGTFTTMRLRSEAENGVGGYNITWVDPDLGATMLIRLEIYDESGNQLQVTEMVTLN